MYNINNSIFFRAVSGSSQEGPGSVFGGQGSPQGGPWNELGSQSGSQGVPTMINRVLLGPQGGHKSDKASKSVLVENEVPHQ